jgi:uncharacterized membrane protein YdfJ with MMPL/SSD domain
MQTIALFASVAIAVGVAVPVAVAVAVTVLPWLLSYRFRSLPFLLDIH